MSFGPFIFNFYMILGEVHFFFSGLAAGPTYHPPVRHSNPDTPLVCTNFTNPTLPADSRLEMDDG